MRRFVLLLSYLVMWACQPQHITPTMPIDASAFDVTGLTPLKEGILTGSGGHAATGTVKIYDKSGRKYIVFDPYQSQSGPDLKVYLSKDQDAMEYIRVGPLMSTTGKQVYELMGNPDLSQYPYVHIWCEKFTVEFARAALK